MAKSVVLLMTSIVAVLVECQGQFRILGLLSEDGGSNLTHAHQTNAQARGFSDILEVEAAAKETFVPANVIKVHLMDQEEDDTALITEFGNTESDVEDRTEVTTPREKVRPLKVQIRPIITEKMRSRKYRPQIPRLRKLSHDASYNSISHFRENSNRLPFLNSAVDLKFHKIAKYRNRYKSKCRCAPITNCPKLQISVPRCQPNYFLCCF